VRCRKSTFVDFDFAQFDKSAFRKTINASYEQARLEFEFFDIGIYLFFVICYFFGVVAKSKVPLVKGGFRGISNVLFSMKVLLNPSKSPLNRGDFLRKAYLCNNIYFSHKSYLTIIT